MSSAICQYFDNRFCVPVGRSDEEVALYQQNKPNKQKWEAHMSSIDFFNLPWKDKWEWESLELPTVTKKFVENSQIYSQKNLQVFNAALYNGDSNGEMTWGDVYARVENYACGLMSIGLEKQDLVSLMSASSPYWTQADLALACANGVSVTIYPTLSFKEASYIVNDSGSKFIFLRGDHILDMMVAGFDEMPKLEKIIVMDREYKSNDDRVISMGDLENSGIEWKTVKIMMPISPEETELLLMTSTPYFILQVQLVRVKVSFSLTTTVPQECTE